MRNFVIALAAVAALAACASRPQAETTPPTNTTTPQVETPRGPTPGSAEDFRVSVGDRVFFGYDRFDLTPEARSILERQAAWMQRYQNVRVLVAGNADERGTREYNLALGARRAEAVATYLGSLGVEGSRVTTISFGKDKPMNAGHDEAAWGQNRNAYTNVVSDAVS